MLEKKMHIANPQLCQLRKAIITKTKNSLAVIAAAMTSSLHVALACRRLGVATTIRNAESSYATQARSIGAVIMSSVAMTDVAVIGRPKGKEANVVRATETGAMDLHAEKQQT